MANAAYWKEQNASKLLPPRTRQHVNYYTPLNDVAPASTHKKRKLDDTTSCSTNGNENQTEMDEEILSIPCFTPSYWESGDARKLFAPKSIYGADCNVQKVLLDRIEKLERVKGIASEWREFVDGGDQDYLCSEYDIFLIQHRSLYLACALRKFVETATMEARWTWHLCIAHAIKLMNDIGIDTYSSWRPLAKWHRRLAFSPNEAFIKSPAPKSGWPPFLLKILMQWMHSRSME